MDSGRIIRKSSLAVAAWSGGVTTQLAIYPDVASYGDRNFLWRVSTASVDAERSDFTLLPGVSRIIMVLEGTLRLIYNGSRETTLNRFGQDGFDGGWNTESIGRVRDFNLMMREGCTGSVEALEILPADITGGAGHGAGVGAPSVASVAEARLHTADGVRSSDGFTDIDKVLVAESGCVSEVYYALTSVRLTLRGRDGSDVSGNTPTSSACDILTESASGDIHLESGDVYIRSCGAFCDSVAERVHINGNADKPTVVVRALIASPLTSRKRA